jgi:hypothetical protein
MNSKQGNAAIITQIRLLLDQLPQPAYTLPLEVLHGSSVGQHFRHILDFYQCLLRDIPSGTVNYAHRDRNPLMESLPEAAGEMFEKLSNAIQDLDDSGPLTVLGDFSAQVEDDQRPALHSSVGRELMYAHDHAVHHLALIRIGIKEAAPGIGFDPHLGYAPATVQHRTESC